jgi:catechol 2,3-dioxygenase-like lactoylglutathione lyase family enzyme
MPACIPKEDEMSDGKKPRLIGINHVAIEVGDIDEALDWYGKIFEFTLRGRSERAAFIDMGDQFINLARVPDYKQTGVERRHIGFVVDDRTNVKKRAEAAGAKMVEGPFLDFLDPWGKPHRGHPVRQYPVHEGPERHARHGPQARQERQRAQELTEKGMMPE